MKKTVYFLIVMLSFTVAVFAQYDERTIMYQNAQQLTMRRQYTEAEQAWLQILAKYPNDVNAIAQLFQLYLQLNQPDKAEQLLTDYNSVLPDNTRMEYAIQLDVQQAKLKDAWDKAQAYLQLHPFEEQKYRLIANYFERKGFFDQAIRLYEQGRTKLGRDNLFNMEIGNNAFYSHVYDKAMEEYIKLLEAQPGNLYFVGNQLKTILKENPDLITQLNSISKNSTSLEVKEVYAISLSRMGRLKEALSEYEQLPTEKLAAFANEQFTAGKDSLAILAFDALRKRDLDVTTLGDITLKAGQSYIRLRQFAKAESLLISLTDPSYAGYGNLYARKKYPYQAYLLLADLGWWQGKTIKEINGFLNDARKLASTQDEIAEVDFRLVGNEIINGEYIQAGNILANMNPNRQPDRQLYYNYLIQMADNQPEKADSLLNQLVISNAGSIYVNDLMTLNLLLLNLEPDAKNTFFQAYRYRLGHRDSLAVQTTLQLSESAQDEELRILAADWALESGFYTWADEIYDYEWQDELLKEYALLKRSRLQKSESVAESMAQDFLKSNPDSVFSPGFRQILQKAPAGRPNL